MSDQWRRRYIGVCSGGVGVSDLWRRSNFGVCRGGVCVGDLWRRSRYFGVCRGGVCVSVVFVCVTCGAAVISAFAEEVSV